MARFASKFALWAAVACVTTLGCATVENAPPIPDGGPEIFAAGGALQAGGSNGMGAMPGLGGDMPGGAPGAGSMPGIGDAPGAGGMPGAGGSIGTGSMPAVGGVTGSGGTPGASGSTGSGGLCYPMQCPQCIFSAGSLLGTPCCTAAGKCGCQALFSTTCM